MKQGTYIALGLLLGVGFGVSIGLVLGVAFDNLALGASVGIALGAGIGLPLGAAAERRATKGKDSPGETGLSSEDGDGDQT